MTHQTIATRVSEALGREITADFVSAVLDGDPFIYERRLQEDREAAAAVLAVARGRSVADHYRNRLEVTP